MTPEEADARNAELLRAYRILFSSPAGQTVLSDLMKFCCFRKDAVDAVDEGKRRAFLRIVNMAHLSDLQIVNLYAGRPMGDPE